MAKILLTNQNPDIDPLSVEQKVTINNETASISPIISQESQPEKEEDFAMFPDWDVVPPSTIINPRKRKMK